MGTNYYIKINCDKCGRQEDIHIGKNSAGWKFCFSNYKKTVDDWFDFMHKNKHFIVDEYNNHIKFSEIVCLIISSKNEKQHENAIDYDDIADVIDSYDFC